MARSDRFIGDMPLRPLEDAFRPARRPWVLPFEGIAGEFGGVGALSLEAPQPRKESKADAAIDRCKCCSLKDIESDVQST